MSNTQGKQLPVIIKDKEIVVLLNNQPHSFSHTHPKYEKISAAVKAKNWDEVAGLIDIKRAVASFSQGHIEIKGGELFYKGEHVHDALGQRIVKMAEEGYDVSSMVAFLDNTEQNPSYRSRTELYSWLEKNCNPLTEDGCFIAYKKVRNHEGGNLYDIYTGKIRNNVGDTPEMARNKVDDDRNRTCSHGLHVCSYNYLKSYGNKDDVVVLVKVNPKDVVSVPVDYNNTKMRVCRYEVLSVFGSQDTPEPDHPVVATDQAIS